MLYSSFLDEIQYSQNPLVALVARQSAMNSDNLHLNAVPQSAMNSAEHALNVSATMQQPLSDFQVNGISGDAMLLPAATSMSHYGLCKTAGRSMTPIHGSIFTQPEDYDEKSMKAPGLETMDHNDNRLIMWDYDRADSDFFRIGSEWDSMESPDFGF